jgi:hypothetical protein
VTDFRVTSGKWQVGEDQVRLFSLATRHLPLVTRCRFGCGPAALECSKKELLHAMEFRGGDQRPELRLRRRRLSPAMRGSGDPALRSTEGLMAPRSPGDLRLLVSAGLANRCCKRV